jgi:hypothetical protein
MIPEGMQLGELTDAHADLIVLLGGLAMPKKEIHPEKANEIARKVLENSDKKRIIGLCFQSMFMQQKWDKIINFDYVINADLAVEVLEI